MFRKLLNFYKTMAKESPFEKFLQDRLTFRQYETLEILMGVSPHRLTKVLDNPRILTVEEIEKLSRLANASPADLVWQYDCGMDSITLQNALDMKVITSAKVAA